ncbi:MAG: 4a-hydroxytetrahydrobiopterin dehydratase [Hyphomonadaceae bacterium]|nr:MAG: 4a-hydroxytetrahydrobiopterin dehydratase [Hyphomonadaceae bacterium]
MEKIEKLQIADVLVLLPLWDKMEGREAIVREFRFPDFSEAFTFMTRAALKAQIMDHHPEWFNVYDKVVVLLTTHDADGVTALDVELAQYMDSLVD